MEAIRIPYRVDDIHDVFVARRTQDLYPDFLQEAHRVSAAVRANVNVVYNLGAVVGAIAFGHLLQVVGRRKSMITALGLSLVVIPLWAFDGKLPVLIVGACLMQTGVGGPWGVILVDLNELSADAARGLIPGLAYQLGILFASPTNSIQYVLRGWIGYRWAIAGFEMATIVTLAIIIHLDKEAHARSFVRDASTDAVTGGS